MGTSVTKGLKNLLQLLLGRWFMLFNRILKTTNVLKILFSIRVGVNIINDYEYLYVSNTANVANNAYEMVTQNGVDMIHPHPAVHRLRIEYNICKYGWKITVF